MSSQVVIARGGGCIEFLGGGGGGRGFVPETRLRAADYQVSRYSSSRILRRSASEWSWIFPDAPPWRFLTHVSDYKARKTGNCALRGEGGGVEVRANEYKGNHDQHQHQHQEIKVCTHRSCRRSGSLQTLDVLRSLAPPVVAVESCGCLGKCGSGPNLVVLPGQLEVSHCSTAAHAARLLELQCGASDADTNLKALGLKERGNKSFELGDLEQAEQFYSEAIGLNPSGGLHFICGNRSAVRLARGNSAGALDDAERALCIAPTWAVAYLRKADAYLQMRDFGNAELACSSALYLDPSLRRSKSFQAKLKQISESLELVRVSA